MLLLCLYWGGAGAGESEVSEPVRPYQFDVLNATDGWIALRENLLVDLYHEPREACGYPGLPDGVVGMRIHFIKLTAGDRRGRMRQVTDFDRSFSIYEPASDRKDCMDEETAKASLAAAKEFAHANGIRLDPAPKPLAVLGHRVAAQECETMSKLNHGSGAGCDSVHVVRLDGHPLKVAIIRNAVPEAPDLEACQFFGHRFSVALQVAWRDLGKMESEAAPGGFAEHYDCRNQLVEPVRVYAFDTRVVIVVAFRGDNIADRSEHLHVVVMPRNPD